MLGPQNLLQCMCCPEKNSMHVLLGFFFCSLPNCCPSSPFLPFLFSPVGSYLPGQAITCFPVSAVSSLASFISSMTSLAVGPTHGEGSPHLPRVLPAAGDEKAPSQCYKILKKKLKSPRLLKGGLQ